MKAAQLLEHFDRLSEAPGAVPRLRRFILDLAVRGKLVEQDAGDEPASALLKKIESEIARLVKISEMRKPKALPPIEAEDEPFDAPTGWRWVRIRQVTSDRGQTTPAGEFTYIDVGSINKEAGVLGEHKVLSASDAPSRARKVVGKGDVLYSCVRPTLLNIAVVEDEIKPTPIASTAFAVLNSFGLVLPRYLWIALRSPYLEAIVESGMRGQAYPAINDAEFALLPLALPPLAEQHRIVAKVDELMALCDQLEVAQQERERRRDLLAAASLQRLNQPAADTTPEAQREHARFHLQHLPRLTTRPEHIKAMRQTFLNLAVRGKLVEHDSSNEHATWATVAVGEITTSIVPQRDKPLSFTGDIPWVTLPCFREDSTSLVLVGPHLGLTLEEVKKYRLRLVPAGSVLMSCVGRFGLTVVTEVDCVPNQQVHAFCIQPNLLVGKYLCYTIMAQKSFFEGQATKTTIAYLNKSRCESLPVNLPPLAEQHRIVAKVDELMALCDQLEAQLTTTQTDSRRLLEAVLEEALAPVH